MSQLEVPAAIGPIRHACHSCGTCCTGWRVRVPNVQERERVVAQAAILGIEMPLIGDALRRVRGRCVFLRDDNLCAIHARFGEAAKPAICKFFPRRSLRAEDGIRAGADPACASSWMTFADGPELPIWPIRTPQSELLAPDMASAERALVRLCASPGMSLPLFCAVITNDHAHLPGLPPGLVTRILQRLKNVTPVLEDLDNGPQLGATLAPIIRFVTSCDPAVPPPWTPLPRMTEAFALDVMARHLFLRLGDNEIAPIGHALFLLAGVLACAYIDPTPSVFGPALSAWSRICRLEAFWLLFMPNAEAGRWILNGS